MPETYTPGELDRALAFFQKMYDAVRIVDPVRERVIGCRGQVREKNGEIFRRYAETSENRADAVSMRAYRSHQSVVQVEYAGRTVLLVTAVPVSVAGRAVVVELLQNVTDTLLIGKGVSGGLGKPVMQAVDEWSDLLSRDVLTRLYNRRFAESRLPADLAFAARQKARISIIFLDVNGFKSINDACGHEAGDFALKAAADSIRLAIAGMDGWAARYGGDEFLVCLTHADEKAAYRAAEKIRRSVRRRRLKFRGREIRISVSAGIQSVRGRSLTARELIACADRNMYAEKRLRQKAQSLQARRVPARAPRRLREWRHRMRAIIKPGGTS